MKLKVTKIGLSVIFWYEYKKPNDLDEEKSYKKLPFMEGDVFGILDEKESSVDSLISIADIAIGLGDNIAEILTKFSRPITDKVILYRMPTPNPAICNEDKQKFIDREEVIYRLSIALEKAGFRNINEYCQFENSIPFIYKNEAAVPVIDFVIGLEVLGHFSPLFDSIRTNGRNFKSMEKEPVNISLLDYDLECDITDALLDDFYAFVSNTIKLVTIDDMRVEADLDMPTFYDTFRISYAYDITYQDFYILFKKTVMKYFYSIFLQSVNNPSI